MLNNEEVSNMCRDCYFYQQADIEATTRENFYLSGKNGYCYSVPPTPLIVEGSLGGKRIAFQRPLVRENDRICINAIIQKGVEYESNDQAK